MVAPDLIREKLLRFISDRGYNYSTVAIVIGVNEKTIRNCVYGKTSMLRETLGLIAFRIGCYDEFNELLGSPGLPGWSETEDYCKLCGTFFHPHFDDGYCEECYRNQHFKDFVPRDVRFSRLRCVA